MCHVWAGAYEKRASYWLAYEAHANQVLCYLCILIYCMKHIPNINVNAIIYTIVIANIIFFPCIFSKQDTDNSAVYEESQMGNLSKLFQQPLLMYTYTLEKKISTYYSR